ncbi:unnamed protein product [Camellia sinensis]
MEVTVSSIVTSIALVTLLTCAWRVVNWVWLRPKQLEKWLREQGFKGNPYKVLYGDTKEMISMTRESRSKPMDTSSDDIIPRVLPSHHHSVHLHGKDYFQWLGPIPQVNIANPKLIKEILLNYEIFQKPVKNPLGKFLVRGVISLEGDKWAMHRNILNPAFHLEKLKHMVPAMCSSCSEMIRKWEVLVSSTKGSCEVDVQPYLDNLTGDVISQTAFGSNYEEGKRIFQLQKEQIDIIIQLVTRSIYIPGWRFLPTKTNMRMKAIYREVGDLLSNIINKRERAIKENDGDNDLLGILLKTNLKEIQEKGNKKNITLTTEDVIEECKLFYLAGQETTSALLVWAMILLSKHQKWQALAREEVLAVFGDKKPDSNGLNQLKTMTMILYEVLRLYPPAVVLNRTTHKKTKVGELVLPPGVELSLPILAIHHDHEIWGKDATEFKPERFSDGVTKATKGPGTFIPFSGGPRICIGQNFSMVEAKIALAMILQRFSFQLSPSYVHAPALFFTLNPQHGKHYFQWMGPIPQVNISDPKLIKEILLNYEVFQKTGQNPLGKLLVRGVLMLDGEKWVKHRNLLNPAFHLEKLKAGNLLDNKVCGGFVLSFLSFCSSSNMEVTVSSIVTSVALVTLLTCAWRVVNWVWLRPKQLEKWLREQGFKGNPYKVLYGDTKEMISMTRESRSKPMDTSSDDIIPRVLPSHHHSVNLHGKDYFEWMGPIPRVNIANPKLIKEILFNYEIFQKPLRNPLGRLLVRGVLSLEGDKWAMHRNLLNPAFHLEKLKHMVPAMCSSCSEMISKWEVLVSSTKGSCEVDVRPYLVNLTADVISRTAFGSNYEEGKRIFQLQKEQIDLTIQLTQSIYIPGWRFLPTKTNMRMKAIYREVGDLLSNIINKREWTIKENDGDNDLLGILLKTNLKEIQEKGNKKNITLTTEEVIEECKLFYLAGQETTSALLVWTMILLSKYQKWQALAREEVLAVFGDKKPDSDGLNQLKTMTMILYEVLRLYSPAVVLSRTLHQKIKVGELVLPPGVEISLPILAIHHDREIWGRDVTEFSLRDFLKELQRQQRVQAHSFLLVGVLVHVLDKTSQ